MLALGIIRKPTVWGFITLQYPGIHVIGLPNPMAPMLKWGHFRIAVPVLPLFHGYVRVWWRVRAGMVCIECTPQVC